MPAWQDPGWALVSPSATAMVSATWDREPCGFPSLGAGGGKEVSLFFNASRDSSRVPSIHHRDGKTYRRNTSFSFQDFSLFQITLYVPAGERQHPSNHCRADRAIHADAHRSSHVSRTLGKGSSVVETWEAWRRREGFVGEVFSEEMNLVLF